MRRLNGCRQFAALEEPEALAADIRAFTSSPRVESGTATAATSRISAMPSRGVSISLAEMFSPLRRISG